MLCGFQDDDCDGLRNRQGVEKTKKRWREDIVQTSCRTGVSEMMRLVRL